MADGCGYFAGFLTGTLSISKMRGRVPCVCFRFDFHELRRGNRDLWLGAACSRHYAVYQLIVEKRGARYIIPEEMSENPISGVETIAGDSRDLNLALDAYSSNWRTRRRVSARTMFCDHSEKITDVYCAEVVERFERFAGAPHVHVFRRQLYVARDNSDANGLDTYRDMCRIMVGLWELKVFGLLFRQRPGRHRLPSALREDDFEGW